MGWSYYRKNLSNALRSIDYITYNDTYSGIYQSQVIDVVEFIRQNYDVRINLIAFVPIRLYKSQKSIIQSHLPGAKVYPMLGKITALERTGSLFLRKSSRSAICRGPLAAILAKEKYAKVVYDARAAVRAEAKEYNVGGSEEVNLLMINAEKEALQNCEGCIAVSRKLQKYWEQELGLKKSENVFNIPCTLTSKIGLRNHGDQQGSVADNKMIRVVYSGGTGPWQSFDKVVHLFTEALKKQPNLQLSFLTRENEKVDDLIKIFPDRVERKWLKHEEVNTYLDQCDYGILIREDNWTNKVASPVKFAEYLNAGLKVLISPHIGDFSEMVRTSSLGIIVEDEIPELLSTDNAEKEFNRKFCADHFFKESALIKEEYNRLIAFCND